MHDQILGENFSFKTNN